MKGIGTRRGCGKRGELAGGEEGEGNGSGVRGRNKKDCGEILREEER